MRTYIFNGYENSVFYCSAMSKREANRKLAMQVKYPEVWRFEGSEPE